MTLGKTDNRCEKKDFETDFLTIAAIVAHELRNPLSVIHASIRLLQMTSQDTGPKTTYRMIERQIQCASRIIQDLLDYSKSKMGLFELQLSRFCLQDLVMHVVEGGQEYLTSREHTFDVNLPDTPIELEGDYHRLNQVLSNLISNAAKYTPPGGRLSLRGYTQNDTLYLSVSDNGIGIPSQKLRSIFDPFFQAHASPRGTERGLGLGLFICRSIVTAHGGTIRAESSIGKGTIVHIELPARLTA